MEKETKIIEPIEIDLDRKRYLMFDQAAFLEAERKVNQFRGVDPEKWVPYWNLIARLSGDSLQAFLWAGLLHEDPNLTYEQVGQFIKLGKLRYIMGRIRLAVAVDLTEPNQNNGKAADSDYPLARNDGSNSGPSEGSN